MNLSRTLKRKLYSADGFPKAFGFKNKFIPLQGEMVGQGHHVVCYWNFENKRYDLVHTHNGKLVSSGHYSHLKELRKAWNKLKKEQVRW